MTMTPEEKAVIQAAIVWRRAIPGRQRDLQLTIKLEDKIWELITHCDECNYGGHVCPGDGNPIGHGDSDCGEHDDDGPREDPLSGEQISATQDAELERQGREMAEERAHLAGQLREIAQDTMQEWMRIVDLEDVAGIPFQARATWQDHQGSMMLGNRQYGDEYGAFQVTVSVTDLGPVQPLGPEDDGALRAEMAEGPPVGAEMRSGIDHTGHDHPATDEAVRACEETPQWIARTMTDVRPGDTIRPSGMDVHGMRVTARCWPVAESERKQTTRDRGSWHVIEGQDGHWSDHVIQPGECCVHLDGAGHRLVKPTFGVEILLSPSEVAAIELLGWDNRERMVADA